MVVVGKMVVDCLLRPNRTSVFANVQFGHNKATAYLADVGLFSFNGSVA